MLLSLILNDILVCLALRTHNNKQNYEDDNGKQKEGSQCADGDGQRARVALGAVRSRRGGLGCRRRGRDGFSCNSHFQFVNEKAEASS